MYVALVSLYQNIDLWEFHDKSNVLELDEIIMCVCVKWEFLKK